MIDLLLVAARYNVVFTPGKGTHRRTVLRPGCFRDLLATRPPILAVDHRAEVAYGRAVTFSDSPEVLQVTMRSGYWPLCRAVQSGGWSPMGISPGWWPLDTEASQDEHGPLEIVHSGHLFEVSVCEQRRGAIPGTGVVGWRPLPSWWKDEAA